MSFMSLSTHGNLHKPLPGLTALFSKSEGSEQTQGYQLQEKIKLRIKCAGATLPIRKVRHRLSKYILSNSIFSLALPWWLSGKESTY